MTAHSPRAMEAEEDASWRIRAACRPGPDEDPNPDPWFPQGVGSRGGYTSAEAEAEQATKCYSMRCPVIDECLNFALATEQTRGVWGGEAFSDDQRRRELRKQYRERESA